MVCSSDVPPTYRMHTAAQHHDIMVHLARGNIQGSPIHPPAWEDGPGSRECVGEEQRTFHIPNTSTESARWVTHCWKAEEMEPTLPDRKPLLARQNTSVNGILM